MCFSAEASFAVGGALVPAGAYCVRSTWHTNPRLLPLAAVPLVFAAQQASEGFVWLALEAGDPARTRAAALVFLFVALAVWPFWCPFLVAVAEPRPVRRQWLSGLALLSTAWFWAVYLPLTDPGSGLTVGVAGHSIRYAAPGLPVYGWASDRTLWLLYLLTTAGPLLLGWRQFGLLPGLLLAGSAGVAAIAFEFAFLSVWCFFAAALSAHLCVVVRRRPPALPDPALTPIRESGYACPQNPPRDSRERSSPCPPPRSGRGTPSPGP
jgi:hypothetical protein